MPEQMFATASRRQVRQESVSPDTLANQAFAVVDLETTGCSATFDRVTEVAIVRVRGGVVEERLETLVDPRIAIPPFIARLTGISSEMVSGQPRLETLLSEIDRLTANAVVVAHNANFDYGFLAAAFGRAGMPWQPHKLCTLRLARRLLPGLPTYRLDALCAHIGFAYVQRHRAGPDANVTVQLLDHLMEVARAQGYAQFSEVMRLQAKPVSRYARRRQMDEAIVASLPMGPGVYLLKDARGHVFYVGKSVNIRQRVRQHLRPSGTACSPGQARLRRRLPFVADVEAISTGSELEALLLESRLVKHYLPNANSLLRDYRGYAFVKLDVDDPFPRLTATRERPSDNGVYFGPFRKATAAARAAEFVSEQVGLRQCSGRVTEPMRPCARLDVGRCLGPCAGAVSREEYGRAVDRARALLQGEDRSLLEAAEEERTQLAENLRFEEAAKLRDSIYAVEYLLDSQGRLQAVAERNLVAVVPAGPDRVRLYCVRAGRVARHVAARLPARADALRDLLWAVYTSRAVEPTTNADVDEMFILDAWLRRQGQAVLQVPVSLERPLDAVSELMEATTRASEHEVAATLPRSARHEVAAMLPRSARDHCQELAMVSGHSENPAVPAYTTVAEIPVLATASDGVRSPRRQVHHSSLAQR